MGGPADQLPPKVNNDVLIPRSHLRKGEIGPRDYTKIKMAIDSKDDDPDIEKMLDEAKMADH